MRDSARCWPASQNQPFLQELWSRFQSAALESVGLSDLLKSELEAALDRAAHDVDMLHRSRNNFQLPISELWLMRAGSFLSHLRGDLLLNVAAVRTDTSELFEALKATPCFDSAPPVLWPAVPDKINTDNLPPDSSPVSSPSWMPHSVLPSLPPPIASWIEGPREVKLQTATAAAYPFATHSEDEESVLQGLGFVPDGLQLGSLSPPPLMSAQSGGDVLRSDLKSFISNGATHKLQTVLSHEHSVDGAIQAYKMLRDLLTSSRMRQSFASSGCTQVLLELHSYLQQAFLMGDMSDEMVQLVGVSAGVLTCFLSSTEGAACLTSLVAQPAATAVACIALTLSGLHALEQGDKTYGNQALDGYALQVAAFHSASSFGDFGELHSATSRTTTLPAILLLIQALQAWARSISVAAAAHVRVEGGRRTVPAGRKQLHRVATKRSEQLLVLQLLVELGIQTGVCIVKDDPYSDSPIAEHHLVAWEQAIVACTNLIGTAAEFNAIHDALLSSNAAFFLQEAASRLRSLPWMQSAATALCVWLGACSSRESRTLTAELLWDANITQSLLTFLNESHVTVNGPDSLYEQPDDSVPVAASGAGAQRQIQTQEVHPDQKLSRVEVEALCLALRLSAFQLQESGNIGIKTVRLSLTMIPRGLTHHFESLKALFKSETQTTVSAGSFARWVLQERELGPAMQKLQHALGMLEFPSAAAEAKRAFRWPSCWPLTPVQFPVMLSNACESLVQLTSALIQEPSLKASILSFIFALDGASMLIGSSLRAIFTHSASIPRAISDWVEIMPSHAHNQTVGSLEQEAGRQNATVCVLRIGELVHDWEVVSLRATCIPCVVEASKLLHEMAMWVSESDSVVSPFFLQSVVAALDQLAWVLSPSVSSPLFSAVAFVLRSRPSLAATLTPTQKRRLAQLVCFALQRCSFANSQVTSESSLLGLTLEEILSMSPDFDPMPLRSPPEQTGTDDCLQGALPFMSPDGNYAIKSASTLQTLTNGAASATPIATLCVLQRPELRSIRPNDDSQLGSNWHSDLEHFPALKTLTRPVAIFAKEYRSVPADSGIQSPSVSPGGGDTDSDASSSRSHGSTTVIDVTGSARSYRVLGFSQSSLVGLQLACSSILVALLDSSASRFEGIEGSEAASCNTSWENFDMSCAIRLLVQLCGHSNVEICKTAIAGVVHFCTSTSASKSTQNAAQLFWLGCATDIIISTSNIQRFWAQGGARTPPSQITMGFLYARMHDAFGVSAETNILQTYDKHAIKGLASFWPVLSNNHVLPFRHVSQRSLAVVLQFGVLPVLTALLSVPHSDVQNLAMQGISACCGQQQDNISRPGTGKPATASKALLPSDISSVHLNACLFVCRIAPQHLQRLVSDQPQIDLSSGSTRSTSSTVADFLSHVHRVAIESVSHSLNHNPQAKQGGLSVSLVDWTNRNHAKLVPLYCGWIFRLLSPSKFSAWAQASRAAPPASLPLLPHRADSAPTQNSPLSFITSLWQPMKSLTRESADDLPAFHLSCSDAASLLGDVQLRSALAWDTSRIFSCKAEKILVDAHLVLPLLQILLEAAVYNVSPLAPLSRQTSPDWSAESMWCWQVLGTVKDTAQLPFPRILSTAPPLHNIEFPTKCLCLGSNISPAEFSRALSFRSAAGMDARTAVIALRCSLAYHFSQTRITLGFQDLLAHLSTCSFNEINGSAAMYLFLSAFDSSPPRIGVDSVLGTARELALMLAAQTKFDAHLASPEAIRELHTMSVMALRHCEEVELLEDEDDARGSEQLSTASHLFMTTTDRFFLRRMAASQLMQRKIVHFAGLVEQGPRFICFELPISAFEVHALRTTLNDAMRNPHQISAHQSTGSYGIVSERLVALGQAVDSRGFGFGLSWVDPCGHISDDLYHSLPSLLQDKQLCHHLQSFEVVHSLGHTGTTAHRHRRLQARLESSHDGAALQPTGRVRTGSDYQTQSAALRSDFSSPIGVPAQQSFADIDGEQVLQLLNKLPLSTSWLTLDGCLPAGGIQTVIESINNHRLFAVNEFLRILNRCSAFFGLSPGSRIQQWRLDKLVATASALLKPHFKASLDSLGSFTSISALCLRNIDFVGGDLSLLCKLLRGEMLTVDAAGAFDAATNKPPNSSADLQILRKVLFSGGQKNASQSVPVLVAVGLVDPFVEVSDSPWNSLLPGPGTPSPTQLNSSRAFDVSIVGLPSSLERANMQAVFNIVDLDLSGCHIGDTGVASVLEALSSSAAVQTLDLSRNDIRDGVSVIKQMKTLFSKCRFLKALHLAYNDLSMSFVTQLLRTYSQIQQAAEQSSHFPSAGPCMQNTPCSIGVLDLAANALEGEQVQVALARFIQRTESLREIDISNNLISASFVLLLLQLATRGLINHLWAVHLSGNTHLRPSQLAPLLSALRDNRRSFCQKNCFHGHQPFVAHPLPRAAGEQIQPEAVRMREIGNTTKSPNPEGISDKHQQIAAAVPSPPAPLELAAAPRSSDDHAQHLSVLYASPLLLSSGTRSAALARLHFEPERIAIFEGLFQARRALVWQNAFMSLDKLQSSLHSGTQVLHLSCHSDSKRLAMEGDNGQAHGLEAHELVELLSMFQVPGAEQAAHSLPYLIVSSSCSSQWVGQAFCDAGVACAVCVKLGCKVYDDSAALFSAAFYAALARGLPVAAAFAAGQRRLSCAANGRNRADADKYVLLGNEKCAERRLWAKVPKLAEGIAFPAFCASMGGNRVSSASLMAPQWDDNGPSFFPLLRQLPAQPPHLQGLNVEICRCLEVLSRSRMCVVQGSAGAGKSTVAGEVARFTALRQHAADGVFYFNLGECQVHRAEIIGALSAELFHRPLQFTDFRGGGVATNDRRLWVASADSVNLYKKPGSKKRTFRGLRAVHHSAPAGGGPLFVTCDGALQVLRGELNDKRLLIVLDDVVPELLAETLAICSTLIENCPYLKLLVSPLGDAPCPQGWSTHAVPVESLTEGDAAFLLGRSLGSQIVKQQSLSREDAIRLAASCGGNPRRILQLAERIQRQAISSAHG